MNKRILMGAALLALGSFLGGCHKHVASAKATPPAVPAQSVPTTPARTPQPVNRPAAEQVASSTPSRMPDAATRARIQELLNRIQDAHFDYNKHSLRPDAEAALQADAKTLAEIIRQYPDFKLTIEGHADERGSEEYNLALGDERAKKAKDYLAELGLPGNQLRIVSYGKEKPVCSEHTEACWQMNRRAHITQTEQEKP